MKELLEDLQMELMDEEKRKRKRNFPSSSIMDRSGTMMRMMKEKEEAKKCSDFSRIVLSNTFAEQTVTHPHLLPRKQYLVVESNVNKEKKKEKKRKEKKKEEKNPEESRTKNDMEYVVEKREEKKQNKSRQKDETELLVEKNLEKRIEKDSLEEEKNKKLMQNETTNIGRTETKTKVNATKETKQKPKPLPIPKVGMIFLGSPRR